MRFKILFALIFPTFLLAQSGYEIVSKAISFLETNDKNFQNISGTYKQKVTLITQLSLKSANFEFLYDVKFENGITRERKLLNESQIKDSSAHKMAKLFERFRGSDTMRTRYAFFPFLPLAERASEKKIDYSIAGVQKYGGNDCYIVDVAFKTKSENMKSEGKGKIWIDKSSFQPYHAEYEISYDPKKGSKTELKQFLGLKSQNGIIFVSRNEIQVFPKVLFLKLGMIKMVYETFDLKF